MVGVPRCSKTTWEHSRTPKNIIINAYTIYINYVIIIKSKTRRSLFSEKLYWHDVSIFEDTIFKC